MIVPDAFRPIGMIGSSSALLSALDLAGYSLGLSGPLLLVGESGTGKDLLARALHEGSERRARRFVTFNAGAMPADILNRELFGDPGTGAPAPYPSAPRFVAEADGGTLYVDDVSRMPDALQARLLQLLRTGRFVDRGGDSRPFTARVVAAINTDPALDLRSGRLRRDLFDMLSLARIDLPPLRARNGDAAEIAARNYRDLLVQFGFPDVPLPARILARIDGLPWPGNVRQLLNVLSRMALTPEAASGRSPDLPQDVLTESGQLAPAAVSASPTTFAEIERLAILTSIERHDGSIQRAADELDVAASTIYRKLKSWQR